MRFVFKTLKNNTDKDLTFLYDSQMFTVKAKSEEVLPDYIALMGAKRLADREWTEILNIEGKQNFISSCLGETNQPGPEAPKLSLKEEIEEQKQLVQPVKEEEVQFPDLQDDHDDLDPDEMKKQEREELKKIAKEKGLEFPNNIPTEKLKSLINE